VSCAKTAEWIEILCGVEDAGGPKGTIHYMAVQIPPWEGEVTILREKRCGPL